MRASAQKPSRHVSMEKTDVLASSNGGQHLTTRREQRSNIMLAKCVLQRSYVKRFG